MHAVVRNSFSAGPDRRGRAGCWQRVFFWRSRIIRQVVLVVGWMASGWSVSAADRGAFFERKVRPLLVAHCGDCHGATDPKSKLNLTSVAGIVAGGASGPVFVPGNLQQSRLIRVVRYNAKPKMPPEEKLSVDQIAILEQWVREGAVFPQSAAIPGRPTDSGGFAITDHDRQWWSFRPVTKRLPPHVRHAARARTAVDAFVLRKLEAQGLEFSPDAERLTLVRRVAFDLVGLPPTQRQVQRFINDVRPDAYERLIDRLLASPHYGVRWGRHWLDTVRYADTNGGGFDYVYPHAWHYRDYVVDAFNQDWPYDRFLVEQLAGDLLPSAQDPERYVEGLKATGLLTLAPKGLGMQDKEQMILDVVDDQIDVLGRALLGLTLSCARCHDHKFDPLATTDYYALAGIFRSTQTLLDTDKNPSYWPERALESPAVTTARRANRERATAIAKEIAAAKLQAGKQVLGEVRQRLPEYLLAAARIRIARAHATAVAHWPFDTPRDAVVNATAGPAGKLSNLKDAPGPRPTYTPGRLGQALQFTGRGDVVDFTPENLPPVELGTATDFTVSLWLRLPEGYVPRTADSIVAVTYPTAMWFIALRPGSYHGIYLRHYDGKRAVDIQPQSDQLPVLTDRRWHHVVFTSDRDGQGRVFLDGQQVGEVSLANVSPAAQFSDAQSFLLGASTNQFRGELDDIAIWDRLLSPSEVGRLFASAAGNRNVAQVEQQWSERRGDNKSKPEAYSYQQAVQQGFVPGVLRQLVARLTQAAGNDKSTLHALVEQPLPSLPAVEKLLQDNADVIKQLFNEPKSGGLVLGDDAAPFYSSVARQRLADLQGAAREIERARVPEPIMGMVAFDRKQPADLRVHIAGDRQNLGPVVPRGVPQILQAGARLAIEPDQSGRLELATWLTAETHPLTARVFVNRLWQWHFGEGIVRTTDNFGRLGELPSHPDLLDWLARRLLVTDWSVKSLHRQIVCSSTYRQASSSRPTHAQRKADGIDSGNRLLWRMNRRRLEGEVLRDAMLRVSGQLDTQFGGTVNTWKPKMFSVDDANVETANYDTRRRSIYLPVVRGAAVQEMLQLFDFGDPNSITARRNVTTVPNQALFLMNNTWVRQQAEQFGERVVAEEERGLEQRVQYAYRLALSRLPTETEQARAIAFLGAGRASQWRLFCQMLLCLNEFAYIE
ncbi:MAG: hypothetical protein CMJ75_10200 [Planctomycetaceae bacterium]|nr:hypothetical protein [Planctomycetaceae bacterium]